MTIFHYWTFLLRYIIAGYDDGAIVVWNVNKLKKERVLLHEDKGAIICVQLSEDDE